MAATIYGFTNAEIKPQPGFSARQSEQGGWVATHEFAIKASDFNAAQTSFTKGALLSDLDSSIPAPFDSFLRISETEFSRVEGDYIFLRVTATGSGTSQFQPGDEGGLSAEAQPTYLLTGQLTDAPFSKHRKWQALTSKEKTILGRLIKGDLWYDIDANVVYMVDEEKSYRDQLTADSDAAKFAALIQEGETTYEKSVYTWEESTEGAEQLTPPQLNKLGLIASPRGLPPSPGGIRNWKLTSVSQSQSGELYRTNLSWLLSDEGGHNTFLYEE